MAQTYRRRRYQRRQNDTGQGWLLVAVVAVAWYLLGDQDQVRQVTEYVLMAAMYVLVAVACVALWRRQTEQRKLHALDRAAIDLMDPLEFEEYVAKLLISRGFTGVELTERFDYGVDVIAHKDGIRWGVQEKHYRNLVKAAAVRQVYTGLARYKCDQAMVVTTGRFSRPAQVLAADNNCVLVNGDELTDWIVDFQAR